ncbi:MAG: hypothetical protein ACOVQ6_07435 [Brevundimonas sp.]
MAYDTETIQITTAVTAEQVGETITGLGAPSGITVDAVLAYVAASATSIKAYVQTSLDGGTTWFDIMCFAFTTASGSKYLTSLALKEVNTAVTLSQATLSDNTSINGRLGDQVRFIVTSVGTYGAGTRLDLTPTFYY